MPARVLQPGVRGEYSAHEDGYVTYFRNHYQMLTPAGHTEVSGTRPDGHNPSPSKSLNECGMNKWDAFAFP